MDANVGRVEEELEQADNVQNVCTVVGKVDSEVQGVRIGLRRGFRSQITLGEEII